METDLAGGAAGSCGGQGAFRMGVLVAGHNSMYTLAWVPAVGIQNRGLGGEGVER